MVGNMTVDIDPNTLRWLILMVLILCGAGANELGVIQ